MQECSLFSTFSPAFIVCRLFDAGHSDQCDPTGAPPHAPGAPPTTPARPHGRRLTEGSLLGFPSGKRLRASLSSWYPFSVKTSAVCSGQGTTILADGIFCLKGGFLSLYIMWSMSVLLTLPSSCSRFVSDCLEASRSARVLKISSRHRKKRNRLNPHWPQRSLSGFPKTPILHSSNIYIISFPWKWNKTDAIVYGFY